MLLTIVNLEFITSFNDTGNKFTAGVNNTGDDKLMTGVEWGYTYCEQTKQKPTPSKSTYVSSRIQSLHQLLGKLK